MLRFLLCITLSSCLILNNTIHTNQLEGFYDVLDKNCSNVTCPEEDVNCPTDSYRLPNHRAPGDCCSHLQGCECLPGPCPEPECVDGQHARAVQQGNQKPGTCCPLYKCVANGREIVQSVGCCCCLCLSRTLAKLMLKTLLHCPLSDM